VLIGRNEEAPTAKRIKMAIGNVASAVNVSPTHVAMCNVCAVHFRSLDAISGHFEDTSHKQLYRLQKKALQFERAVVGDLYASSLPITCLICKLDCTSVTDLQQHVIGQKHRQLNSARATDLPASKKVITPITYNM
jgi:hypothetical protein